jgi:hypothetical protein
VAERVLFGEGSSCDLPATAVHALVIDVMHLRPFACFLGDGSSSI